MAYLIRRHALPLVVETLSYARVTFLMGARQVGKSTLVREIAAEHHAAEMLSLDDQATRQAAAGDPTGFVAGLRGPVVIDEVQRVPDLLLAIKDTVDRDPRPGRFLLTGSANILTAPRIYDALSGRINIERLWPLSQAEIEAADANIVDALFAGDPPQIADASIGRDAWVPRAALGGYPEVRARPPGRARRSWFEDYLTSVLQRDLRDLTAAYRLDEMPRLLRTLAAQAADVFVAESTGNRLGLDRKTVQSYTGLLETVFLVQRIPAWRPGLGAREIQKPKLYFVDTGLLADVLGADERRIAHDAQIAGRLLENFVGMELVKQLAVAETRGTLHHYRRDVHEVDVVIENRAGELVAAEVKASASITAADHRELARLRDARGASFRAGALFYAGERTLPLGDRLWALPISALWA
jgi:predicted AAA+ superfamily ATPase